MAEFFFGRRFRDRQHQDRQILLKISSICPSRGCFDPKVDFANLHLERADEIAEHRDCLSQLRAGGRLEVKSVKNSAHLRCKKPG